MIWNSWQRIGEDLIMRSAFMSTFCNSCLKINQTVALIFHNNKKRFLIPQILKSCWKKVPVKSPALFVNITKNYLNSKANHEAEKISRRSEQKTDDVSVFADQFLSYFVLLYVSDCVHFSLNKHSEKPLCVCVRAGVCGGVCVCVLHPLSYN